ncbi:MAG: alpha/beta hydrolase [Propionibacteriaceae bacterium]|nr:alpha/beta hydrolase [Propionibacteriaceae bacterium]
MTTWVPDTELVGYEQFLISLEGEPTYALEPEGSLVATVVRRNAPAEARAVLYVHGWNDYFFQTHLADEMAALGFDFYALDLRRYGRSLRKGQLAGYITSLDDYFVELDAAVELIRDEGHTEIVLMGHSTGGLTASLYADARPGTFAAVVLNAPWLEASGNTLLRPAMSAARTIAATQVIPVTDTGYYRRSISASEEGEWEYNLNLKGDPAFRPRVGWLAAVTSGHARIAEGLRIDCPVLVAISERSLFSRTWGEEQHLADTVLDVNLIAARAPKLGNTVAIVRISDGMHDLVLSREEVRAVVFAEYARFLQCYATPAS